jgi:aspartyl protease family protein
MKAWHSRGLALAALLAALPAAAQNVALVGVIGDKAAILSIDGGAPKAVKTGQTWNGIGVVSVEKERATIEIGGKKRVLLRGQHASAASTGDRQSVTLSADPQGHFFSEGAVNGVPVRFLVDTGASSVVLTAADANRLGINYRKGERGTSQTAAGPVPVWRVRFDTVRVGGIELSGVEGVVIEQGLDFALLGTSFLNRTEMRRDGQTMVLLRRY